MNIIEKNSLLIVWAAFFLGLLSMVLFIQNVIQAKALIIVLCSLCLGFAIFQLFRKNLSVLTKQTKLMKQTKQQTKQSNATSFLAANSDKNMSNQQAHHSLIALAREVDRAILSNASLDRIIKILFANSQKIIPASFAAVSLFNETKPVTFMQLANGLQSLNDAALDKSIKVLMAQYPEGVVVNCSEQPRIAEKFPTENVHKLLINPIYKEGNLVGLLTFGLNLEVELSAFELSSARDLADKLGVANTISVREKELKHSEYFDTVTQLLNRQACYDRLTEEIARVRRQQAKLSVLYINLNQFKKVNDALGHAAGDLLLKEVAERLKSNLREIDIIARFGADEFVVVVSDIDKLMSVNVVARKIIESFEKPFMANSNQLEMSARIGISIFPDDGITAEELIQYANMAMLRVKKNTEEKYAFYEANMSLDASLQDKTLKELTQALVNEEFYLFYQPQVCSRSGKTIGLEALVRWLHPERGLVSPAEFIPICEESGLILKLGQQVREMACAQYQLWLEKGIKPPKISLNVSVAEIQNENFAAEFIELLEQMQVPSSAFEIEITETMLMESEGKVGQNLKLLNDKGITIALDDFGTGYSNLSYLVRMPFHVLKVDQSFVKNLGKYPGSTEIVTMIIDMAHHLGKVVVAEGVETESQKKFLSDSSCDVLQGYLLGKPLAPEALEAYLSAPNLAIAA